MKRMAAPGGVRLCFSAINVSREGVDWESIGSRLGFDCEYIANDSTSSWAVRLEREDTRRAMS